MGRLFEELKRRNVIRVAIAYAVVSWILAQVADLAASNLSFPSWFMPMVLVVLSLGLPIAMLLAWAFEMTPEGVKKTKDISGEASVTSQTGQKINYVIGAALVLALGFIGWQNISPGSGPNISPVGTAQASIAVLPFINMSSDPEQEYFSDGISEEILNVLAKIPELHVTSRSSAFSFKGKDIDIPTVAKALGVAHVLEGSIRKSGLTVRITAQLIEASSDKHLWSQTYDRDLNDIFAVQDEIAAAIVVALKDALGLQSIEAPQPIKAPVNTDAYTAFLLGQHLIRLRTKADIEASIPHFEKAIALDPNYAPAHAALGLAWNLLLASNSTYGTLTLEDMLAKALPSVERALALDPNLADAHGVMGLILQRQGQVEQAITQFQEAVRLNPSLTNVRNWLSLGLRAFGREGQAFEQIKIAYHLDPLSRLTSNNYAAQLIQRRSFEELATVLERFDELHPARAASSRGRALNAQHKAADGIITMLRGVDATPGSLRVEETVAFSLMDIGLADEALRLWPHPDGGGPILAGGTDYERDLAMAQRRYQDDPNNLNALEALAWAYFNVGNQEQAQKMAARHLGSLGPAAKSIASTNLFAVLRAWAQNDQAAMQQHLAPLEADIDARLAAGIDIAELHWDKAIQTFLRGQNDAAYEHAKRALSMWMLAPAHIDFPYRHLGWNDIPRFKALRDGYETYLANQRQKLLSVACGDTGFDSWKPLPETCALLDQS
ncbi:MAG: tetratricopeptide repeat protein [Robiginitomaculum sp.]|nr:tetratricopeptide repeat protein [Robiginitomaculum sp.]